MHIYLYIYTYYTTLRYTTLHLLTIAKHIHIHYKYLRIIVTCIVSEKDISLPYAARRSQFSPVDQEENGEPFAHILHQDPTPGAPIPR